MDIDLLKTFITVFETGNFNRAAERLNVTQSTVSVRIQNLENQLGQGLFVRSRAGTEVTPAGRRFQKYAASLMRVWLHARQELALPEAIEEILSVGSQFSLWDNLLSSWVPWMRKQSPGVALRMEIGQPEELSQRLLTGDLDIAVMYTPQNRVGFLIEKLLEDRLIAVSTEPHVGGPGTSGYIFVDWGPEFTLEHARAFSEIKLPSIMVSHGLQALKLIQQQGGSCYLPSRTVAGQIKNQTLFRVGKTPAFQRPAFAIYPEERVEEPSFVVALDGLRKFARKRASFR